MALADLLEIIPQEKNGNLPAIFAELMEGVSRYADPETGLYYQVVDQGGREGNYLETSGSSMIAYAMLKGARLGFLEKEYAAKGEKTFHGIVEKYLSFTDGNTVVPMVSSMDHKRAGDGDTGLNTGGMGTVAPNPYYTEQIAEECMERIL